MKMTRSILAATALGLTLSAPVAAEGFYAGGGVNQNSASGVDNEVGFQIFGGYNLGEVFGVDKLDLMIEGGYYNSGIEFCDGWNWMGQCTSTSDVDGIWSTAVFAYRFDNTWSFFGRAGLDFGEDDGLMIGGGAAYHLNESMELRGELVERDNITSLQGNFVMSF